MSHANNLMWRRTAYSNGSHTWFGSRSGWSTSKSDDKIYITTYMSRILIVINNKCIIHITIEHSCRQCKKEQGVKLMTNIISLSLQVVPHAWHAHVCSYLAQTLCKCGCYGSVCAFVCSPSSFLHWLTKNSWIINLLSFFFVLSLLFPLLLLLLFFFFFASSSHAHCYVETKPAVLAKLA